MKKCIDSEFRRTYLFEIGAHRQELLSDLLAAVEAFHLPSLHHSLSSSIR